MIWLAIALSFSSLAALCLAMEKHHVEHFGRMRVTAGRMRNLRIAGWLGLAALLGISVADNGWALGPLFCLGSMSSACMVLTFWLQPYRPRLIVPLALSGPPLVMLIGALAK